MADKGAAAGSAFLTGVLAKLAPEDRQKGEEALRILQSVGGGAVVSAVGDGTLAQEEFSRLSDTLKTQQTDLATKQADLDAEQQRLNTVHDQQVSWFDANRNALEEYKTLKANGTRQPANGHGDGTRQPAATDALTAKDYDERIANERASFLGFQRDLNHLQREHYDHFKEVVDLEPLLHHPQIGSLGLMGVYQLVHKDRLEKFEAEKQKVAEEAIRADERRKVLEANAALPYPTPTGIGSGSPLDALTQAKEPLVDAATAHYNRLQAERAGHA